MALQKALGIQQAQGFCKKEISKIHEESHGIYGAPKITEELKKKGHVISEKTVGNYMHEMHIKAHYIKPWTKTTVSKNFSNRLRNILKETLIQHRQMQMVYRYNLYMDI
ncbi:MAG: transposase [Catenibacterium sp.]|uniref:transposase n=1 Tax=Catenibacterium sp. TaxID=2049022 RepID=UPI0039959C45